MASDDKPPQPRRTPRGRAAEDERKRRLAAALRANLRRRKAQRRARGEAPPGEGREPEGG